MLCFEAAGGGSLTDAGADAAVSAQNFPKIQCA
jgi:hypothetical protein